MTYKCMKCIKSFLNSTFFQTIAVIFVGVLAYNVAIEQNNLSGQLAKISYSPKYNETIHLSPFERDLRMENIGRVSLHNIQLEFVDLYVAPRTIRITGDTNTTVYDLEPGSFSMVYVPDDFKVIGKTILVRACYMFNENPLDRIDDIVNPLKLKDDPFYEYKRRLQAYRENKCSSILIKYDDGGSPIIM